MNKTKVAKNGAERKGGRQKGTPNKDTSHIIELCNKLKCDPVEVLIHIAKGDWSALGYDSPVTESFGVGGIKITENIIELDHRLDASKTLMNFIYPKRKAIEISDPTGNSQPTVVLAYSKESLKKAASGNSET